MSHTKRSSPNRRARYGITAAVLSGIGASACCVGPAVLGALGLGSAWASQLTALDAYRPWFVGVAVLALGFAAFQYHRGRLCDDDCERPLGRLRGLLLLGIVLTGALISIPAIIGKAYTTRLGPVKTGNSQQVILKIDGMTCAACVPSLHAELSALRGVSSAVITLNPPQAILAADTNVISIADMIDAVREVGYRGTLDSVR